MTTLCGVRATLRPSFSFTASVALPHWIVPSAVACGRLAESQVARSVAPERSSVEMIMKPNRPGSGTQDVPGVGHGGLQSLRHVMSKVRSTPDGLSVAWLFAV